MNRLFGAKNTAPKPTLQGAISGLDSRIESIDVKLAKLNAELSTYQQRMSKMRDGPGKNALKQKALKVLQQRKMYEGQREQLQQQTWNMEQAGMMQDNLKSCSPSSSSSAPLSTSTPHQIYQPQQASSSYSFLDNTQTSTVPRILLCTCLLLPPSKAAVIAALMAGALMSYYLSSYMFGGLISWPSQWARNNKGYTDVMVTVDALKTTNKELKKQYGKINLDKIEQLQDEMADLMDLGNEIQESISRSYDVPDEVDEAELDAELEALSEEMELNGGWEAEAGGADTLPAFLQEEVPSFLEEGKAKEPEQKVAAG